MTDTNDINIDILETLLGVFEEDTPNDVLYAVYGKIFNLVSKKDKEINKNRVEIENKDKHVADQEVVIKRQIEEICLLHHALESYNYYPRHPKDVYIVDFGYAKWRTMSYRACISTREGEKVCKWVQKKKLVSDGIKSFRDYLNEIGYNK